MTTGERPLYVYPGDHHRVVVWRTLTATWLLVPGDGRERAVERAAEVRELLEPGELATLRRMYGARTASEMLGMAQALPCWICFVPLPLRPPGLPWPSHAEHQSWVLAS